MDLYFSPLACSLASRIALYEAGLPVNYIRVKDKKTPEGNDYFAINARGQVPALKLDDGELLTENVAVLEYIADLKPEAALAPKGQERVRMRKWLGFINSEIHVANMGAILSSTTPEPVKAYALERARKALAHVDKAMEGRQWLTESFTVADAYLAVATNWLQATPIQLSDYPNLQAHQKRVFARPAAAKAVTEEFALYRAAA
ncbi:MAG TPA: glutathione binding-like protein [Hyphomonadaceae bacterium]|nr:glutathione binding-like protein [Hyphomonadaceae bacterium]